MTKQHRDVEEGDAGKQQLHRERIAEPVRVGVGDVRQLEQGAEGALPVGDSGSGLAVARPEDVLTLANGSTIQFTQTGSREGQDYGVPVF